jgi:hypothetical protein
MRRHSGAIRFLIDYIYLNQSHVWLAVSRKRPLVGTVKSGCFPSPLRICAGSDVSGTRSRTSVFSLCRSATLSTTIKSFILCPVMGINGSYVMWTLPLVEPTHQANIAIFKAGFRMAQQPERLILEQNFARALCLDSAHRSLAWSILRAESKAEDAV